MKSTEKQTRESGVRREGDTRSEILDAAATLIVEKGYSACTMRSISQELNIKAASLYYHFRSKDDIVVEIMNIGTTMLLNEVRGLVSALPDNTSFNEVFSMSVKNHINCKLNLSTPFMRVYEHLPPIIKRQSRSTRKQYTKYWVTLIESGKQTGDVRSDLNANIFANYLLGGLNRIPEWFHSETMDVNDVIDTVTLAFWEGVHADRNGKRKTWTPRIMDTLTQ